MRLVPPLASALVARVYEYNLPVSLIVHKKDYTELFSLTAEYESEDESFFDKLLAEVARNLNQL